MLRSLVIVALESSIVVQGRVRAGFQHPSGCWQIRCKPFLREPGRRPALSAAPAGFSIRALTRPFFQVWRPALARPEHSVVSRLFHRTPFIGPARSKVCPALAGMAAVFGGHLCTGSEPMKYDYW